MGPPASRGPARPPGLDALGLAVDFPGVGVDSQSQLPAAVGTAPYRVVQEVLTNVALPSEAARSEGPVLREQMALVEGTPTAESALD